MAQGDLFSDLMNSTGLWSNALSRSVIDMEQLRDIQAQIVEQQMNIYETKRDMLKSDYKGINVFKRIASSGSKILEQTEKIHKTKKTIQNTEKHLVKIAKDYDKAKKFGNFSEAEALKKQHQALQVKNAQNKIGLKQMQQTIPILGKLSAKGGKIGAVSDALIGVVGGFTSIIPIIGDIIGGIISMGKTIVGMLASPINKAFNIFLEMQNTVGNLAADIGLTANESRNLLNNFATLTLSAMKFGGSMKDVATIFQQFSETTNKNRFFNEREIGQLVELGLGTGLGVQGASELAASFDNIGISLENTINLTDRARNLAAKYNVNTTKVLKTYQGLVQSLTGIGFGKGLDNLTKLAAKATAIRFDIAESTKSFADAFFDPEKAVEASARMQTLGGKFAASFGDPMQLAFESMTDPTALAEKFANTVSEIAQKDGKGGYFISPADRKMLKIAAETLGQNYEDAVATAIEQKKMADKMSYLSKSGFNLMGLDDEKRMGIANLMQLNEKGKYEIKMSDGTTQLLENMTDKNQLPAILDARAKNEKAAIQRLNMMQRFENVVNRFMMGFSKVFDQLFGGTNFESFLQMVENAGEKISQFIVKDLLGSDGLANGFNTLIDKAKIIFSEIETIFAGNGSFMSKVGETLKLLFKDVAVPIITEVIKFAAPILQAGIGKLLELLGGALPDFLGGNRMKSAGLNMQADALSKSSTLKSLYGQNELIANKSASTGGSFAQGAGLYGKAALGMTNIPGGLLKMLSASKGTLGKGAMKLGGAQLAKRIPILGALVSAGLSINDLLEGDLVGAGLNLASGAANVGNIFLPGVGSAVSMGIDATNAAREMGAFDDGVIYKDGSYAKFSKGDMVQFIDQAAMERASNGYGSGGNMGNGTIQHGGTIIIKSDDGKVVTWDQMYNARDLIGSRISSINKSYENGFGNYQDSNISPIKPLM
jgi:hypothetical protein